MTNTSKQDKQELGREKGSIISYIKYIYSDITFLLAPCTSVSFTSLKSRQQPCALNRSIDNICIGRVRRRALFFLNSGVTGFVDLAQTVPPSGLF